MAAKKKRPRGGASVPCPRCKKGNTRVVETRRVDRSVQRLRRCTRCPNEFTTIEVVDKT